MDGADRFLRAAPAQRRSSSLAALGPWLRRFRRWAPLLVLLALCVGLAIANPRFIATRNLVRIASLASVPLMIGIGETLIILLGSIDLSVEGMVAVSAMVVVLLGANDSNSHDLGWVAALAAIAVTVLMADQRAGADRAADPVLYGDVGDVVHLPGCRHHHAWRFRGAAHRHESARARAGALCRPAILGLGRLCGAAVRRFCPVSHAAGAAHRGDRRQRGDRGTVRRARPARARHGVRAGGLFLCAGGNRGGGAARAVQRGDRGSGACSRR